MSIPIRRFFSYFEKRMFYSLYLVARDLGRTENTLDKRCCGYSANCFYRIFLDLVSQIHLKIDCQIEKNGNFFENIDSSTLPFITTKEI